jgi:hypothetical protein
MANFSDNHVVLLEKSVDTNKEVIEENKKLREEMKRREEDQTKVLKDVLNELKQLKEAGTCTQRKQRQRRRKGSQTIKIPTTCRVSTLNR